MDIIYQFESERLGFRHWKDTDKEPFANMNANSDVMEFFPNKLTKEQSDELIERINNHFKQFGYGLWAVEVKKTHEFIGFIGFSNPTFEAFFTPCIEIGWRLDSKYWNLGYATEGAKACLDYGFNKLGLKDIYSFTSLINKRSSNVMRKIGMMEAATFDHPRISEDNPLRLHVLYKIEKASYDSMNEH